MLQITKIFHFEMAHAIHGYAGKCKNIHGHSYELHVTIMSTNAATDEIPSPGFIIDFKDLKDLVNETVIDLFDHRLVLSKQFLENNQALANLENLYIMNSEPTAENILLLIRKKISNKLPPDLRLTGLKLFETKDSYAVWEMDTPEPDK